MRRIVIALMGTLSGLVLLLSYHTSQGPEVRVAVGEGGGGTVPDTPDTAATGATPSPSDAGGNGASPSPSGNGASPSPAKAPSGTFTGDVVDTQWGPVQVRIVVRNAKITKATAIRYPDENHRDQEINSWAVPALQDATIQQQNADFDGLSGATVTSNGYKQSLQSALDRAHL